MAVASPPGHGGVGLVRVSGRAAARIGQALVGRASGFEPRRVLRAAVQSRLGRADALITFFSGPASYTGEDVLEISAHGNPVVLAAIVEAAAAAGARPARPGEFTLRAFLHGKIDLVQAEAVRAIVEAVSPAQARLAADHLDGTLSTQVRAVATALRSLETYLEASMDFPDEGYRFIAPEETAARLSEIRGQIERVIGPASRADLVRDGARIVVAGSPNVGKSSVFNAVVGAERAIVTEIPGTTRDLVSERVVLGDMLALLVDTAGLRASDDVVEREGIRRAGAAVDGADLVLAVLDRSRPTTAEERAFLASLVGRDALVVLNKADLPAAPIDGVPAQLECHSVSARTGSGIGALVERMRTRVASLVSDAEPACVVNARQRGLLAEAMTHVARAADSVARAGDRHPEELVVADVRLALDALESVVGRRTPDDILHEIFASFCIGK